MSLLGLKGRRKVYHADSKQKKAGVNILISGKVDFRTRMMSRDEWAVQFSSVQSLSCVRLFVIPWTAAHQASLSITNSWSLLKLTSIELVMPSNHLILRILLQRARPGFDPWVGKIPWKRERLPTPVFWPREFHGLGSQTVGDD